MRTSRPSSLPRAIVVPLLVLALVLLGAARAQAYRVEAGAWAAGDAAVEPRLAFSVRNAPVDEGRVGFRLGVALAPEPLPAFGLELRRTFSFGPVGNVLVEAAGDLDARRRYAATVGARGVAGPVALGLEASAWNAPESAFAGLPGAGARPRLDGPALGLAVGASYRAGRTLVLSGRPELLWANGGLGGRLEAELRLARVRGDDDALALAHLYVAPGAGELAGAVGAGYALVRRRAPTWLGSVWFGAGPAGPWPGVRLRGGERGTAGASWALELAAEPYRLDVPPLRAVASYRRPLGDGTLAVEGGAAFDPWGPEPAEAALRLAWEWGASGR